MTPRLLVAGLTEPDQRVDLSSDQVHYVTRVLRLRDGQVLQLFDGQGARWKALLETNGPRPRVRLVEALEALPESPLELTLVQCISSADHMDFTIEKAVELGVAHIVPVSASRSLVKLDETRAAKRLAHWQRLVVAACMQCGRDTVPSLSPAIALPTWLESRSRNLPGWVLSPTATVSLVAAAGGHGAGPGELLVGPESGLSDDELLLADQAGLRAVHLGPRVLRTETAGLAAIAVLQSSYGDLV